MALFSKEVDKFGKELIFFFCWDFVEGNSYQAEDDDLDFLANVTRTETYKVLKFGQGSVVHGRDSRYWDKDDRRRDDDYNEDVVEHSRIAAGDVGNHNGDAWAKSKNVEKKSVDVGSHKGSDGKGVGLYNEAGRDELKMYEAEYEASLKNSRNPLKEDVKQDQRSDNEHLEKQNAEVESFDEYDDGIDYHDVHGDEYDDIRLDKEGNFDLAKVHSEDGGDAGTNNQNIVQKVEGVSTKSLEEDSLEHSRNLEEADRKSKGVSSRDGQSSRRSRSDSKRKGKRRKFSGIFCKPLSSASWIVNSFCAIAQIARILLLKFGALSDT